MGRIHPSRAGSVRDFHLMSKKNIFMFWNKLHSRSNYSVSNKLRTKDVGKEVHKNLLACQLLNYSMGWFHTFPSTSIWRMFVGKYPSFSWHVKFKLFKWRVSKISLNWNKQYWQFQSNENNLLRTSIIWYKLRNGSKQIFATLNKTFCHSAE